MIPLRLVTGLNRYKDEHKPTGLFLRSVLANNLHEAVLRADPDSMVALHEVCMWILHNLPGEAWGTPEKVDAWVGLKT